MLCYVMRIEGKADHLCPACNVMTNSDDYILHVYVLWQFEISLLYK